MQRIQWATLTLATAVLMVGAKAPIELGDVGKVKKLSEDGKAFEIAGAKNLKRTEVVEEKDTKFMTVELKPFSDFKEGDTLFVLGKKQEGNDRVPASITGIIAIASGDFEAPELPEKHQKVKGLEWVGGALEKDGQRLKLGGASLTTGGSRLVAVFKEAKRHEVIEKNKTVYVRGRFHKKEKGEKFNRLLAEKIYGVHPKLPPREREVLFDLSIEGADRRT